MPTPGPYPAWAQLDGTHPWIEAVPDGAVLYPVCRLRSATVRYFNFSLAREMGLIPEDHPEVMKPELEQVLRETFALRIVNEYDQLCGRLPRDLRPNRFMATRYLQIQHADRKGRTSGDGRSIWNGTVTHRGRTWDVSSRGTGVTCLAPGAVEAGRPLKTGGGEFGYGCGLIDLDELYAGAVMSEIFHRQGIGTERVLLILDLGHKTGIGVRAHPNLIRPAHLFRYLKLRDYANLRRATDYYIRRQVANGDWSPSVGRHGRYAEMSERIAVAFARLAARLDVDYIFVWLEWDGDNILCDGSIIDYGGVRQFGLRHDQYRYDDVTRMSTNLNEQRRKARAIVQTFIQLLDYLRTGSKKSLRSFARHRVLRTFDATYESCRKDYLLARIGFGPTARRRLLERHGGRCHRFLRDFRYFERTKTSAPARKVFDGVNRPAIFNLRDLLRELPRLLERNGARPVASQTLFDRMLARQAEDGDRRMRPAQARRLQSLQRAYLDLVDAVRGRRGRARALRELAARSSLINRPDRITGNGVTIAVEEIMRRAGKESAGASVQEAIDALVRSQAPTAATGPEAEARQSGARPLVQTLLSTVEEYREDV